MTYAPPTDRSHMTTARAVRIFVARRGRCGVCKLRIADGEKYDIDHPDPLWAGGSDDDAELWPVHIRCHKAKTKAEAGQRAERNATIARGYVGASPSRKPFPGSKASGWKKRMDGSVILRGGNHD